MTIIQLDNGIEYECVCTNYQHPSVTTGQHTNGPCVWWYRIVGNPTWHNSGEKALHKVRKILEAK